MRRFLFGLLVAAILFGNLSIVSAQSASPGSISSSVTLSGHVPEMRFIYINQDGYAASVVGNTSRIITPRVAGLDNKEAVMTDAIWQQYVSFMNQHDWRLDAGVTYQVNPVQVNNEVSAQKIVVPGPEVASAQENFNLTVYN